jgi:hypothetical protein
MLEIVAKKLNSNVMSFYAIDIEENDNTFNVKTVPSLGVYTVK